MFNLYCCIKTSIKKSWFNIKKKYILLLALDKMAWLKPYIDLNTELRKLPKMNLKKTFINYRLTLYMVKLCKMIENIEILN